MRGMTKSLEDYLESILLLELKGEKLHSISIAKMLGVSKPAVTRALKKLAFKGYVSKMSYEDVRFTKEGRLLATKIYHRHTTIKQFLLHIGLNENTAEVDCCKIEHVISDETLRALEKFNKSIK